MAAVFRQRVAVGHAGDKVADKSLPAARAFIWNGVSNPLGRHEIGRTAKQKEEVAHDVGRALADRHKILVAVHVRPQESLQGLLRPRHIRRECHRRPAEIAHLLKAIDANKPAATLIDHVLDEAGDYAARHFVDDAAVRQAGMAPGDLIQQLREEGHRPTLVQSEQPGAKPIVEVVGVVGDVVGDCRALRLG